MPVQAAVEGWVRGVLADHAVGDGLGEGEEGRLPSVQPGLPDRVDGLGFWLRFGSGLRFWFGLGLGLRLGDRQVDARLRFVEGELGGFTGEQEHGRGYLD